MAADKGGPFERDVAHHLSKWWTGGRDDTVWRTPGSGGRATVRRKKGKATFGQAGDLCSTDPVSRGLFRVFAFELKCGYTQVTLNDLIDRPKGFAYQPDGWDGWVEQARAARKETGAACWCLIHHRNRGKKVRGRRTMVYFPLDLIPAPILTALPEVIKVGVNTLVKGSDGKFRRLWIVGYRFEDLFGKLGEEPHNQQLLAAVKSVGRQLRKEKR